MSGKGFPGSSVIEGEWVVTTVRQHSRMIWLPAVFTAVFVALLLWIWITMSGNFWGRALFWCVVLLVVGPWVASGLRPFLRWYGMRYAFTNRRVIVRQGVFNPRLVSIQFVRVNNAIVDRHGLDGLFRSGTLILGPDRDHRLEHVPRAEKMLKLVLQLTALSHEIGADVTWLEQNFRSFRNRPPQTFDVGASSAGVAAPAAPQETIDPVSAPAPPSAGA